MKRLFATGLMLAGLSVSTATAQTGTGAGGTGTGAARGDTTNNARHTERDDDGFNLGWLGLIGLAGVIPRKQKVVHHDGVATDHPSTNRA